MNSLGLKLINGAKKKENRRTKVWGDISRFRVRGEMWKQSKKSLQGGKKDFEWKRRYLSIYVIVQGEQENGEHRNLE